MTHDDPDTGGPGHDGPQGLADLWREEDRAQDTSRHPPRRYFGPPPPLDLWKDDERQTAHSPGPDKPSDSLPKAQIWDEAEDSSRTDEEPSSTIPWLTTLRIWGEASNAEDVRELARHPSVADRPSRWAGISKYVVPTILFVLALLIIDGAYVAVRLERNLKDVAGRLEATKEALDAGRVDQAEDELQEAVEKSREFAGLSRHPAVVLGTFVPFFRADIAAVLAISQTSEFSAEAGLAMVEAARRFGVTESGLADSVYSEGRVDLSAVKAGSPSLGTAEELLSDSAALLESLAEPRLSFLREGLAQARSTMASAVVSVHRVRVLTDMLPGMLGDTSKRRYLLAFQALGEARGTGGILGMYGVLEADNGRLDLVRSAPLNSLPDVPAPVRPPRSLEAYGEFALTQWTQANSSPNFPGAARVWMRMYRATTGKSLDGVIAMDPIAFQQLLRGTDAVTAPGLDIALTSSNAAKVLMEDSYLAFETDAEQERYLERVIEEFWNRIHDGDIDLQATSRGLSNAVATQHFKFFSTNKREQGTLRELGADGSYDMAGPNVQLVFNNNYSANKVDVFLKRKLDTRIEIDEDGDLHVTTRALLENQAPAGPPSVLLGRGEEGLGVGVNQMVLSLLLPERARPVRYEVNETHQEVQSYKELEHPVVWQVVEVPPGDTAEVVVSYRVRDVLDLDDGSDVLDFTLFPQATAIPADYRVVIKPPPRMRVTTGPELELLLNGAARTRGTLDEPLRLQATIGS